MSIFSYDGACSVFDFVDKHRCFKRKKSVANHYRKSVEGIQQWDNVGELGKVENKACGCILYQLQRSSDGVLGNILEERFAVVPS